VRVTLYKEDAKRVQAAECLCAIEIAQSRSGSRGAMHV
jgi:hypothetical protein